ncbi:MAG: phage tail assembly chaperone, partial [Shewanella oncorhynchi]
LDESIMTSIIIPIFGASSVFCVEENRKIKSSTDIDLCFTMENLFDLYELIFEVVRYQFEPFLQQGASRFGSLTGGEKKPSQSES